MNKNSSLSQTVSTVIQDFRENLEFENNCKYMKYLVLIRKIWIIFEIFFCNSFLFKEIFDSQFLKKCINKILLGII